MIRILTDNDYNGRIVRGVLKRRPEFDLIRVQDVGLAGESDRDILQWAALHDRIVLSHDFNTMIGFARARIAAGEVMPGLFVSENSSAQIGAVVESLLMVDFASEHEEWANRIEYLPL